MENQLKITIAQLNPILGNIDFNCGQMLGIMNQAKIDGASLIVFSEMSVTGYPAMDLWLKSSFLQSVENAVAEMAKLTLNNPAMLIGMPYKKDGKLYNASALLANGKIVEIRLKNQLPNYGVFTEKRYFSSGPKQDIIEFKGLKLGIAICEDVWSKDVVQHLKTQGADIIIAQNASPYCINKILDRQENILNRVTEVDLPFIYINQVGGQDELVFDGASFVIDANSQLISQFPAFIQSVQTISFNKTQGKGVVVEPKEIAEVELDQQAMYHACVLGLRDYVSKNHFKSVLLGLSGGVDSALVAAIAVDAIGEDKVHAVMLPYDYTTDESIKDAEQLAKNLGINYNTLPIIPPVNAFLESLAPSFKGMEVDTTEENIQSRTRGTLLMALSNKFGALLLTTGNKSELSVGYGTLYGDMCGGFNPIKDIYKTDIFELCKMRNETRPFDCLGSLKEIIPINIIVKAPSAELKPNQTDQDSLPEYEILDDVLNGLVEKDLSQKECVTDAKSRGIIYDIELVKKVSNMLYNAEFKRFQSPPGVKVSAKALGSERQYPITNGYVEG